MRLEIDGSFGSAGGQILRTALSLSAITKKPCHVFNIRKNRPKPGLALQHLLGLQALAQLCNAQIEGDFLDSEEIKFSPGEINGSRTSINVKIETAGSITLLLQTLFLPSLFASEPVKIIFAGGATDTFFSPTMDYFQYVFLKIVERTGARVKVNILKRGYYPEGGAEVEVKIEPAQKLKPIALTERGKINKILAISGASASLKAQKVAERQLAGVREILGKAKLPLEEKFEYYDTFSPGSQICLAAEFENTVIGADNLGKFGKRAEEVGKEAALSLLKEEKTNACLDKRLADQILPFMALAGKKSEVSVSEITEHCRTNIWVIEQFLAGRFEVKEKLIRWLPQN